MSFLEKKTTDYLVLVNEENRLPENFADTVEFISVKNSEGAEYTIEKKTYEAFLRLREDILANEGFQIELISVFRTIAAQEATFARYVCEHDLEYARKYVAIPGHSEHHTGIAIDVGIVIDGKIIRKVEELLGADDMFRVIQKKLPEYGFILRYPKGKEEITKIGYESWHFRYIDSPEIAKEMADTGLCFEEYWEKVLNG